jgi:hypothetical protein
VGAASGGRNLKKLENTVFLLYPISPPKSRVWGNFHEKTHSILRYGNGGTCLRRPKPFWGKHPHFVRGKFACGEYCKGFGFPKTFETEKDLLARGGLLGVVGGIPYAPRKRADMESAPTEATSPPTVGGHSICPRKIGRIWNPPLRGGWFLNGFLRPLRVPTERQPYIRESNPFFSLTAEKTQASPRE